MIYKTEDEGILEIYTDLLKKKKAEIKLQPSMWWTTAETDVYFEETEEELYLVYQGRGSVSLLRLNLKGKTRQIQE